MKVDEQEWDAMIVRTVAWIYENPEAVAEWAREHTEKIETDFGTITLVTTSPFFHSA